jgi:hypothetical protein
MFNNTASLWRLSALVVSVVLLVGLSSCTSEDRVTYGTESASSDTVNQLTAEEEAEGWRLLFDGSTFTGWRGIGRDDVPTEHWEIVDGAIHKIASGDVPVAPDGQPVAGGDLMTEETFENFELAFEWKISPGGNSGVKYNVSEEMSTNNPLGASNAALGFEYQVLDDEGHPDAKAGDGTNRTAAALYDLKGPIENKPLKPVGEWNEGRILVQGNHAEHWLNGVKVVEYDLDSEDFKERFARSKYVDIAGFADKRAGHIVLQDHNDDAWYRNIKIRVLPAE